MPIYTVQVPAGTLDTAQKREVAQAITSIHVNVTAAPPRLVNVVFEEIQAENHYLAGEPSDNIVITGRVREGRSDQDKQRILREVAEATAKIIGRDVAEVGTIIRDVPSKYIFEGGQILPEPGHETD
ncbi:tautomerase family protein [Nocardia sp. NEAU-G5]|uniref:Tautomerase family protein n=1 Tax=Nocardia albiluteola TaxID=2842303 RepID=A0ABS6AZD0_9NOCA|nr:tautomerase family protein [Nocardia albiluteola]MBU3062368.1 tautomerase family protein [Nocardia albiluteola]